MNLSIIVATSLNNAIGKNNQLMWHLPADLNFFKTTTMGCPIIMGRKTFQSIGRSLPGRKNIVLTKDEKFNLNNQFDIEVFKNLEDVIKIINTDKEVFIIGGGEIYKHAMHLVNTIYRTIINIELDGDVYFDEIDLNTFKLVWEERHKADDKNKLDYTFQKFNRI